MVSGVGSPPAVRAPLAEAPVHLLASCWRGSGLLQHPPCILTVSPFGAKHLQTGSTGRLFSVCLGCDTISILHFNDSFLYYYCLNHFVYLLSPCPIHFPSLLPDWPGPMPARPASLLPQLGGRSPPTASQGPALPAGNLTQTRCGFLLLFLLLPLIFQGLQGAEGEERLSTHILLSPQLPCPALRPMPRTGRRGVHDRTSV